jgi:hypothetical protein
MNLQRMGNWYSVDDYNVVIIKEKDSFYCDPSSILVFDSMFNFIKDEKVREDLYEKIERVMKKMDWKYDLVDED